MDINENYTIGVNISDDGFVITVAKYQGRYIKHVNTFEGDEAKALYNKLTTTSDGKTDYKWAEAIL